MTKKKFKNYIYINKKTEEEEHSAKGKIVSKSVKL